MTSPRIWTRYSISSAGIALLLGLAAFALDFPLLWILSLLAFGISSSILYFFRDPERTPPEGEGLVVSPADGRVLEVAHGAEGIWVGIFMSLWNVHVVRSPIWGRVVGVSRRSGVYRSAFSERAGRENAHAEVVIGDGGIKVQVRMIAGALARRVDCWVEEGEEVKRGDRIGMIRFGSRVEVTLPDRVELRAKAGERVKAGESILGVIRGT